MAFKVPETIEPGYVLGIWRQIGEQAPVLFTASTVNGRARAFVAGGDLMSYLSHPYIMSGLRAKASDGVVEIAGTPHSLQGINVVAELYQRWGVERRCSDERLPDTQDVGHGVHCKCGMCAAVGAASGVPGMEDWLLGRVRGGQKHPIREMPHASIVLQASINTPRTLSEQMRARIAELGAAEFRLTVPVTAAKGMQRLGGIDVLDAAAGLSAGPLAAIIQGHNQYAPVADERLLVLDQAGASAVDIDAALQPLIKHFDPASLLRIDSANNRFRPVLETLR